MRSRPVWLAGHVVLIIGTVAAILFVLMGGQFTGLEQLIFLAVLLWAGIKWWDTESCLDRLERRNAIRGMLRISPDSYGQRALDEMHGRN